MDSAVTAVSVRTELRFNELARDSIPNLRNLLLVGCHFPRVLQYVAPVV